MPDDFEPRKPKAESLAHLKHLLEQLSKCQESVEQDM